ncbi:MAG: hypothetical protein R3E50_00890 [Halioglobus sp.]
MTRQGNWADMSRILSDEVLEPFVPRGTFDVIAVLRDRYQGLTRRITFPMPENPADDQRVSEGGAPVAVGG